MKYCLKCGQIFSDKYLDPLERVCKFNLCTAHDFPLTEDTEISEEMFYNFSEKEKDAYEQRIYNICKQSEFFNEEKYLETWEKPYNYYLTYRFDKYERLTGKKARTKDNKLYHDMKAREELNNAIAYCVTPSKNVPRCPTCQSENIRKIGGLERGASIGLFGLFSKKINKTFKCNNCGYTW